MRKVDKVNSVSFLDQTPILAPSLRYNRFNSVGEYYMVI